MAPWLIAALVVLVVSMAMQTKLPWYPLAALPTLAVSGSMAWGSALMAEQSKIAAALRTGLALIALATLSTAGRAREEVLAGEREFEDFRRFGTHMAATVAEEPFIGATEEHPSLVFYGGRPIRTFKADELDRLLLDPKALPRTAFVPAEHATALLAAGAVELGRLGDRVLVRRRGSYRVLRRACLSWFVRSAAAWQVQALRPARLAEPGERRKESPAGRSASFSVESSILPTPFPKPAAG